MIRPPAARVESFTILWTIYIIIVIGSRRPDQWERAIHAVTATIGRRRAGLPCDNGVTAANDNRARRTALFVCAYAPPTEIKKKKKQLRDRRTIIMV